MSHRVCPFWMGYLLACPVRRLGQSPEKMLSPFLTAGMTVLEVGPAMGFFTLPMARMVGPGAKVVAVDVQPKMQAGLRRRAQKAGLADRIEARVCGSTSLGVGDLARKADFVLAFAVVHEIRDAPRLFGEIVQAMKPGARCLVAEPKCHVPAPEFEAMIATAVSQGLELTGQASIWGSHSAVFTAPRA